MPSLSDDVSMALFCDFENIALGVRDAQFEKFDIKPILERLLLKGSIVVKKAYCDWDRYKSSKAGMHEANFELIEIPHLRLSGKNSADIRLVVDALDLCYTKSHVNTFVIISGDSDFSPLVSKLRENAKRVIGVGVKQSTSDLLIANCDEFIYIDDLMRKRQRDAAGGDKQNRKTTTIDPQELESRRIKGLEMAVTTLEAMLEDRTEDERVWASVLKEAIKRRHPGFNENYHGYRTLGAMLEDAHKRGLLEFGRENNSAYVKRRGTNAALPGGIVSEPPPIEVSPEDTAAEAGIPGSDEKKTALVPDTTVISTDPVSSTEAADAPASETQAKPRSRTRSRTPKKTVLAQAETRPAASSPAATAAPAEAEASMKVTDPATPSSSDAKIRKSPRTPVRKSPVSRTPRLPKKTETTS